MEKDHEIKNKFGTFYHEIGQCCAFSSVGKFCVGLIPNHFQGYDSFHIRTKIEYILV